MKWIMNRAMANRAQRVCARLAPHLPDDGTVLDVGCGTGHNAEYIRSKFRRDVSEADVADMKTVGPPPMLFDGQNLPFEDGSFDTSLLLYVLHYATDQERILRELRRVTRNRLLILQSTYNGPTARSALSFREFFLGRGALTAASACGVVSANAAAFRVNQFMSRDGMEELLKKTGWKLTAVRPERTWPLQLSRDLFVAKPE
ncbi:MAG: methyltransferase domain-containing protein [Candidatus Sumerlaeota bacterium]